MTKREIELGARIAREAIMFSVFNYGAAMKNGELREKIKMIFGPEVDAALNEQFSKPSGPNAD